MKSGSRSSDEVAVAIAHVCADIEQIRETVAGSRTVTALLAALRVGADAGDLLEALHAELRQAGDARGVFGQSRDVSMSKLSGVPERISEPVLLCPRAERPCARFAWPGRGDAPVCAVANVPLRRTTLAP